MWGVMHHLDVRFWPLADIPYVAFDVAFGVKRTLASAPPYFAYLSILYFAF
jgi:hypothetical protein